MHIHSDEPFNPDHAIFSEPDCTECIDTQRDLKELVSELQVKGE
jgi:hypothetical protein